MLKIAEYNTITGEKVDLKELEKFGFKIDMCGNYADIRDGTIIRVWKDRTLIKGFQHSSLLKSKFKIKDLIQAGLVEKIEE